MALSRSDSDSGIRGVRKSGGDAVQLTIDYVKQETLGPIKGLGRFLVWGLAGSFAIAIGLLLLLVGVLRLLQEETGRTLTGNWSWVPYFAVGLLGLLLAGVAAWRIAAGPAKKRNAPKHKRANSTRAERKKAESERAESEKAEREKAEREKAEREKAEREKAEREKAESGKAESRKAESGKAESRRSERKRSRSKTAKGNGTPAQVDLTSIFEEGSK
jgi:hypothetical protein